MNSVLFERLIEKNCIKNQIGTIVGLFLLLVLSLFFIGFGIAIPLVPIMIPGLLSLAAFLFVIFKFKGDFKGSYFWIDQIKHNPQNIIWIKPIVIRNTVAYVVTLYKEREFQLLTKDGLRINLKCDSAADQQVFFDGVKKYLSHSHIGYTHYTERLYKANPVTFLDNLKAKNLYTPVTVLKV